MDWYQIQLTRCSPRPAIIHDMWGSIIEGMFHQYVPQSCGKLLGKQASLWISMMLPLMFAFLQCSLNPRSLAHKRYCSPLTFIYIVLFLQGLTSNILVDWTFACLVLNFTANWWERRCLYWGWNSELSEPERCAEGSQRPACKCSQVDCLQRVINFLFSSYYQCTIKLYTLNLNHTVSFGDGSILDYELLDVEIPTITVVKSLVTSGIPVLVYRYEVISFLDVELELLLLLLKRNLH